jgi:hypothetical protein
LVTPRISISALTVRPGPAVDEMQRPVMRPPVAELLEDPVGIGREAAIGEEHQLDRPAAAGRR